MKLYYASSVCSLAVRIILHELGLACEYESVDLKTKQTETAKDYLAINPKGSVPVLQLDDQQILTETAVILQYLADQFHAVHLLPPVGDIRRYRTLEWLNFISTDLHRYCGPLFWTRLPDTVKQEVFLPVLNKKLTIVDQQLKNNTFLMGDAFTIGDSYLFVILIWMAKLNMDVTEWPTLPRYFAEMKQRKSVQQAMEEEGLSELSMK
jgi:glutathione S-transferase